MLKYDIVSHQVIIMDCKTGYELQPKDWDTKM